MRLLATVALILAITSACSQQPAQVSGPDLPDAPSHLLFASAAHAPALEIAELDIFSSSLAPGDLYGYTLYPESLEPQNDAAAQAARQSDPRRKPPREVELDKDGNPVPLNRQQPHRILGFMPNFRSVSGGAVPHPPGWKYNFKIATRQAFDYSSFIFLGITSLSAEGINSHPVLRKGVHGFYSYTWRGLLDKTDGTYMGAWLLPSLLHEDTRYYALGPPHRIVTRALYIISRQGVARTYGGHQTPNIAGLGGKVLTQLVSRQYYPTGATSFGVLATKFGYASARDVGFTSIREFYPDIAAHYIRKHREKMARLANATANQSSSPAPTHE